MYSDLKAENFYIKCNINNVSQLAKKLDEDYQKFKTAVVSKEELVYKYYKATLMNMENCEKKSKSINR